jgi:hypothetical protein
MCVLCHVMRCWELCVWTCFRTFDVVCVCGVVSNLVDPMCGFIYKAGPEGLLFKKIYTKLQVLL